MKYFAKTLSASALLASVFYAVAACSGGSGNSGGGGAGSRESFIAQYCEIFSPCCGKVGKPTDGAACRAFITGVTAGAQYNATAASKCLEETRALASAPTFCDRGASGPSCDQALGGGATGTAKPGDTCSADDDCAPSTEGDVRCATAFATGGGTTKKCQLQLVGKASDTPCVGTVDDRGTNFEISSDVPPRGYLCNVSDGLRCDSTTKACVAIAKVGEACDGFGAHNCTSDAYCDTTKKQCVARKAVGEACDTFGRECVATAYCNSTTKMCTATVADGGACKESRECASSSCVNDKCEPTMSGATFLCGN